jgi:hypothetical protein
VADQALAGRAAADRADPGPVAAVIAPAPPPVSAPPPAGPIPAVAAVRRRRRRRRGAGLILLAVVIIAAAVIVVALRGHGGGAPAADRAGASGPRRAAARAGRQAVAWVTTQVGRSVVVGCDPHLCAALQTAGRPASSLVPLTPGAASPLDATVIVATAADRARLGAALAGTDAPGVLARFGPGAAQVQVRVVAPHGAAAYQTSLHSDQLGREQAGTALLSNSRIELSTAARADLASGAVDSRLLLTLPALAAVHPIQVLGFGGRGPGASAGMPLCWVRLGSTPPAGMKKSAYIGWLRGFVRGQRPPYDGATWAARDGAATVINIRFSSPSPLGLIGSKSPGSASPSSKPSKKPRSSKSSKPGSKNGGKNAKKKSG